MRKIQQGFTLIELMIVVAIIGILAAVAIPNYQTYTKKAKFTEVIQATSPFKLAVEGCYQERQSLTECVGGSNGVPTGPTAASGYVQSVTVGATGTVSAVGSSTVSDVTFVLTPTAVSQGTGSNLTWAKSGTCSTSGLC